MQCREVDIGVSFDKPIDTSFMNDIMQGGIADSGLESNGDVFLRIAYKILICKAQKSGVMRSLILF